MTVPMLASLSGVQREVGMKWQNSPILSLKSFKAVPVSFFSPLVHCHRDLIFTLNGHNVEPNDREREKRKKGALCRRLTNDKVLPCRCCSVHAIVLFSYDVDERPSRLLHGSK